MNRPKLLRLSALACLLAPSFLSPQLSAQDTFASLLAAGTKSIAIAGKVGDIVSIYRLPAKTAGGVACSDSDLTTSLPLMIMADGLPTVSIKLVNPKPPASAPPFLLSLVQPLIEGDAICIRTTPVGAAAADTPKWGKTNIVQGQEFLLPQIQGKLVAGSKSVTVLGHAESVVSLYEFDSGFNLENDCTTAVALANRTALLIVTTGTTTPVSTSTDFKLASKDDKAATTSNVLTLSQPLVAGTTLCLSETATNKNPVWATPQMVTDPDDYHRVRSYFIAGIQASNQQAATNSSTAGQYLEGGLNYAWIRAKDRFDVNFKTGKASSRSPGISANFDVRLSPIPVAAPATTTTTPTTGTPATTVNQNALSSQQALRVVTSVYSPWKLTHFDNHSDYLTIGPLARSGFGTLLNPSSGASTNASQTTGITTTNFSSAYNFVGFGARFGWDRYPASTDEAPVTITHLLVTLGRYSNLPSYVCKPLTTTIPAGTTAPALVTACNSAKFPSTSTKSSSTGDTTIVGFGPSKAYLPRLDIEGLAKLPNYPFVLGLDANLQQFTIPRRSNVDYLNKPGNDVRIYVGFQVDLNTIVGKLGVKSQ